VQSVEPDAVVDDVAALDDLVARSARTSRFLAVLFGGFAGVGVLLGAIGIFGITSDAVARRRQEIAIRVAIGAEAPAIVRLVVRQSVTLAVTGIAIGLTGAWVGSRYLSSLLFGVAPTDPVTYVAVPIALLAVVLVSCLVPARRATRIDPVAALRS
jgi:ABC-type antimicrobial peptide transport system permease subunit